MIRYGSFDFACPPRTGTYWFIRAVQLAGFGPGFKDRAHAEFGPRRNGVLRVSLVRHPCDWLASCYAPIKRKEPDANQLGRFVTLPSDSFHSFVSGYIEEMPGEVGRKYAEYRADVCLRIEDMPWAVLELLESLRGTMPHRRLVAELKPQNVSPSVPDWNVDMRRVALDCEDVVAERYDYD